MSITTEVLRGLGVTRIAGREQALMTSDKELLYVAGRNVMWHNTVRDRVRVLPQTPKVQGILAIAVCPKRRYVAICEQQDSSHGSSALPQVSIIDLISGAGPKRLRTLVATEDTHLALSTVTNPDGTKPPLPNFTCCDFSKDSKSLLCLVGAPYNGLVVFDWFRSRKVGTCTINATVTRCRFNPSDSSQVSTSGPQHLRVWKVQEGMLKGYPTIQGVGSTGASITDHAWTQDDRLAVTTDHGEVSFYDEGDLSQTMTSLSLGMETHDGLTCIESIDDRGFVAGGPHGSLCVIELTDSKDRLEGRDPFKVTCHVHANKESGTPSSIVSVSTSPKCDVLIISFPDNVGMLNMSDVWLKAEQGPGRGGGSGERGDDDEVRNGGEDEEEDEEERGGGSGSGSGSGREVVEQRAGTEDASGGATAKRVECALNYLVKGFHTGSVTSMSSCARKPLLITCSKEDKSIRLWNYRKHVCVDALTFENDAQRPLCVDIHPSGHVALACFSGRVHLYHVRLDGLRYSREILVKGARMARFSGHGGMIAVACSRRLEIYRTYTEECVGGFTGHSMPITDFAWRSDDMGLVSCATDGSVYEWELAALNGVGHAPCGTRAGEHHSGLPANSGFTYNSVACGERGAVVVAGSIPMSSSKSSSTTMSSSSSSNNSSSSGVGRTPVGFGSGSTRTEGEESSSDSKSSTTTSASNRGKRGLTNNDGRMLRGWRKRHLEGKGVMCPTSVQVTSVSIETDHLVAAGSDGSVTFYDFPLEQKERSGGGQSFFFHQVSIASMAMSPDSKVIFTGGIDGTIVMSLIEHSMEMESRGKSSSEVAATSTRPYLDEIICLTDVQEQEAIQGKITDLEASIIDLKGTWRYEKRETLKARKKAAREADLKLCEVKKLAHEQDIELKRLLRASESEGKAKADAKESTHMQTAKLLEDLYDRKLVNKQEDLRNTQNKLRDLIVKHEDAEIKQRRVVQELRVAATSREERLVAKFQREKKQMEQYIQFVKERYEETAEKSEDGHDVELLRTRQEFERERGETELKRQTTQGEIVLLKKSASMMKESLDEEKKRADMARAERLQCERNVRKITEKMEEYVFVLKKTEKESSTKDEQIKLHLRRVGDLERVRRVLQHQLHEARGQLEPMDTELSTMKDQITELNKEYTSGMKAAAVLERKTKTTTQMQHILQRELAKTQSTVTSLKSTILKFSRDVESIVTAPGANPAKWAEGLLSLYRDYVTNLPIEGKISGPDDKTMKEFHRQRMFMEKTVKALKKQSSKTAIMVDATKRKVASENMVLVTELNGLRKTVKRMRNEIERLQSDKLNFEVRNAARVRRGGGGLGGREGGGGGGRGGGGGGMGGEMMSGSNGFNGSNGSIAASSSSGGSVDNRPESSPRATSLTEGGAAERRTSALSQVAKTRFASTRDPHPRIRRPASAVAGTAAGVRPKSGGRPLTARERRNRMPTGPSLSRSMTALRASKSEKTLSVVQTRLDEAYLRDQAKDAEIQRLQSTLKERERRNRQLEDLIGRDHHGSGMGRSSGGGGGKTSPGSASILSDYSRASSLTSSVGGGKRSESGGGKEVLAMSESAPSSGRSAAGRNNVLSPLAQKSLVKSTLRVG